MRPYIQAGKRATRIIHLQAPTRMKIAFDNWWNVQARRQFKNATERARALADANFFEEVLERLPKFKASILNGDFSHRELGDLGYPMILFLVKIVSCVQISLCYSNIVFT